MMFREKSISKLYAFALAAVFALTLAGCGGGGGTTAEEPPPMPTPQEMCADAGNSWVDGACLTPAEVKFNETLAAIMAATTAEAAQAAYDAVKDDVSASDGEKLQAAVDERVGALAMMARAEAQKMALMTASDMIDTSDLSDQTAIDAAQTAIDALQAALDNAADVNDEDKAMYQSQLDTANMAVGTAQANLDTQGRMEAQRMALTNASAALTTALGALSGTPTQEQIDAAQRALNALKMAIEGGADLEEADKASHRLAAANAMGRIEGAEQALMAANDAAAEEQRKADAAAVAAMAVTASKLYAGISAPSGNPASPAGTDRAAAYNDDGDILVSIGDGTNTPTAVELSEDEDTTVAAHHGWQGQRFTAEPDGDDGTYEAVVYSNVGESTEGAKFNDTANGGYTLDDDTGETADVTTLAGHAASRVASPSFDHSAGTKTFELPTNNVRVMISGSYRGVPGTYYCTPTGGGTDCSAAIAESGFTLAGGTWTFKPTNPETRFMDVADAIYASYGWWLHKSEDGDDFTASAFVSNHGEVPAATGIDTLLGTATYMGGAAGKYALQSSTGGTNDAGHFTARATLEADFSDNSITGTIDNFMGADGQSRDWSVELKEAEVAAGGAISRDDDNDTVWTMDGTKADASGEWSGTLYDNGDDLVPKVGTGTFYTEFGTDGKMVGAFGVNKQ